MHQFRTLVPYRYAVALLAAAFALTLSAAKPVTGPPSPSAIIFADSFHFTTATQTFSAPVSVPQDGAWIFGEARYADARFMDCDHHYVGEISPISTTYVPFFKIGFVPGSDTPCESLFNACFSCGIDFGGLEARTYYTTSQSPGFLPAGNGLITLHTLNGGSGSVGAPDTLRLSLLQVNVSEMESMTVLETLSNEFPAEASPEEKASRAYIAASDDRVPLMPQFTRGGEIWPATPEMAFSATWDTGDIPTILPTTPNVKPGNMILLIEIPRMKTGNHKVTVTATLPSGKIFTALPYQVFVYNVALETLINGGAATTAAPVIFTRADTVTYRVQQQDTKGKAITVSKTDWRFRQLASSTEVTGAGEVGLAPDSKEWGGTMVQPGIVSVGVTIKTGKQNRTSHTGLSKVSLASARTGTQWDITRSLCENCFDDFGVATTPQLLRFGVVFPSRQNVNSDANFPENPSTGGITIAVSGEKRTYETGLIDDVTGDVIIPARSLMKMTPLHRPHSPVNDPPDDWNNRYQVERAQSGPNRGYWYVKSQSYTTHWAWAFAAWFKATSAPGALPSNYKSWVPVPGCSPATDVACYTATPISCWADTFGAKSYWTVATTSLNPSTGLPFPMNTLVTQSAAHEKRVHYDKALVDFMGQHPDYEVGKALEATALPKDTEAEFRQLLDNYVRNKNITYAEESEGGGYEESEPPVAIPVIEDTPIGAAACTLIPSN